MNDYQKLVAVLKVATENIQVLHHNIEGAEWFPTHEKLAEYYGMTQDMADDLAEIGISLGYTEPTIAEALAISDAIPATGRKAVESFTIVVNIFTDVADQMTALQQNLDEKQLGYVINKLQEYEYTLRKEAEYKLAQALS